jgi:hypothetical protein
VFLSSILSINMLAFVINEVVRMINELYVKKVVRKINFCVNDIVKLIHDTTQYLSYKK